MLLEAIKWTSFCCLNFTSFWIFNVYRGFTPLIQNFFWIWTSPWTWRVCIIGQNYQCRNDCCCCSYRSKSLSKHEKYDEKLRRSKYVWYWQQKNWSHQAIKNQHTFQRCCRYAWSQILNYLICWLPQITWKIHWNGSQSPQRSSSNRSTRNRKNFTCQGLCWISRSAFLLCFRIRFCWKVCRFRSLKSEEAVWLSRKKCPFNYFHWWNRCDW